MDKEHFTERILETENLTDELEDSDANWLLNWGIGQLDRVLQGVGDEETAGGRVNALMAVMRKINRIVGNYADKSPGSLAGDLAALHELFAAAFSAAAAFGAPTSFDAAKAPPAQPEASAQQETPPPEPQPAETHRKGCVFWLFQRIKPGEESQPPKAVPGPEKPEPAEPPAEAEPSQAPQAEAAADTSTASAGPEVQPSTGAGFEAAAAHLAQLSPRQALEFLAQDFFPIHN